MHQTTLTAFVKRKRARAPESVRKRPRRSGAFADKSNEEILLCAYVLDALGRCSAQSVVDALAAGDALNRSDFCIAINNVRWVFEYDGSLYHGPERADADVAKTHRVLALSPTVRVLRIREGAAPPLPALEGVERCVVLSTGLSRPQDLLPHICRAVGIPCARTGLRLNAHEAHVDARALVDANLSREKSRLEAWLGRKQAHVLCCRPGVLPRLPFASFVDWLQQCQRTLSLTTKQLLKVCCGSFVAAVGDEDFLRAIEQFQSQFGFDTKQLTTVLGDSTAAALANDAEAFLAAVKQFQTQFGFDTKQLTSVLTAGTASALVKNADAFLAAVRQFQTQFVFEKRQLTTVLRDSTASALANDADAFLAAVRQFQTQFGFDTKQITTVMENSTAAALANDANAFLAAVRQFQTQFGFDTKQLTTVLTGSTAAALANDAEAFFAAVEQFQTQFGFDTKQLTTVMNNCLASALVKNADAFLAAVRQFQTQFGFDTKQLTTVLTGGTASALVKNANAFLAAVKQFQSQFGFDTKQLTTVLRDGTVSALVKNADQFIAAVRQFQTQFGFDTKQLTSVMNNSMASALANDADAFLAAVRQFQTQFGFDTKQLTTVMKNGTVSALANDAYSFSAKLDRLRHTLPKSDIVYLLYSNCIVSRLRNDASFGTALITAAQRLQALDVKLSVLLRAIGASARMADAVPAIAAHLGTLTCGHDAVKWLKGLKRGGS